MGPPDQITTDIGKNFASKEFNQYTTTAGYSKIKIVPVEAYNSVGIIEHYHRLIRRTYTIITTEIYDINRDIALQIAFKAINDSIGPDRLVPILLVYSTYLRLSEYNTPVPTIIQQAIAIKKAIAEIQKLQAKYQVIDILNIHNSPDTTSILDLPLNSDILV